MHSCKFVFASLLGALAFASTGFSQPFINFSDLPLPPESYHNDSAFTSGGATFNNSYDSTYFSWGGFAYSNIADVTTPDYTNQYSAITGNGFAGSSVYAVAYMDTYTPTYPRITLPSGWDRPLSLTLTNTTYTYFTIQDGNDYASAFTTGDYFYVTITAYAADGTTSLGSIDFYLADYRSANAADHYLIDQWTTVDLSSFGNGVSYLGFDLTSSDTGAFGMNTPAYFAVGGLSVVPEPSTAALLAVAAAGGWWIRRRPRLS